MSYEIIEKNEYGIKVKNTTGYWDCDLCKHDKNLCGLGIDECNFRQYYLTDQEAAKLETELTTGTFTINDLYVESKLLFDCQDKLNNLQIENKQLKERIEELEGLLRSEELKVSDLEHKKLMKSLYPKDNSKKFSK